MPNIIVLRIIIYCFEKINVFLYFLSTCVTAVSLISTMNFTSFQGREPAISEY